MAAAEPKSLFPDIPTDIAISAQAHNAEARREAVRRRVRAQMPPFPELRFEQAYLRSVVGACRPRPADREAGIDASTAISVGHQVHVDWAAVSWITLRDQVISPLVQGMFWGLLSVAAGGFATSMRSALPARVAGDAGGPSTKTSEGGGSAVGGNWWRSFVRSIAGGAETTAVLS